MGKIVDFIKGIIDGIASKRLASSLGALPFVAQGVLFMRKIVDFIKRIIRDITSKQLIFGLGGLLAVFFVVLLLVMFFDGAAKGFGKLFGTMRKKETIEFIGWGMSGAFVAIGLVALSRRAEAQIESNRLVEKGHRQERFKTATEHLGHQEPSVRIAAFYEFLHLIKESREEYRKSILDILYAYMRTITDKFARREDVKNAEEKGEPIKFTEEIQGLLDILFKSQDIDRSDIEPNLQRIYFSGADLSGADLSDADLRNANLFRANLSKAKLPGADLFGADLRKVIFIKADLSRIELFGVKLPGANFFGANLSEVCFIGVDLSGANMSGVNFSGAKLLDVDLSGARMNGANFSDTDFSAVDLSGADLSGADLSGANWINSNFTDEENYSKILLEKAIYTNTTQFPEWIVPPIAALGNGNKVRFPEGFLAPELEQEIDYDE